MQNIILRQLLISDVLIIKKTMMMDLPSLHKKKIIINY